jgi:hypothetical protein
MEDEHIDLKIPKMDTGRLNRRRTWFLNGQLVRIHHISRAQGIVTLHNLFLDTMQTTTIIEFRKKRRRAFTVVEAARLLNFHRKSIPRLVKRGVIPNPTGELPGGVRAFQHNAYYSEDQLFEMREALSQVHHGRARKDGLISNNKTPSESELRHAIGDGMMLFVRNDDGRMVPVFSETL